MMIVFQKLFFRSAFIAFSVIIRFTLREILHFPMRSYCQMQTSRNFYSPDHLIISQRIQRLTHPAAEAYNKKEKVMA